MGWCSATSIFDAVAEFVLATDRPDAEKQAVLKVLAAALENEDWDCQGDSAYMDEPIVQAVFRELDPDWQRWEDVDSTA